MCVYSRMEPDAAIFNNTAGAVFDSPPLGYTVSEGVGQTTVCVQVTGIVQTDITIAAHTEFFFSAVCEFIA